MKKFLSILLSFVIIFSFTSFSISASDTPIKNLIIGDITPQDGDTPPWLCALLGHPLRADGLPTSMIEGPSLSFCRHTYDLVPVRCVNCDIYVDSYTTNHAYVYHTKLYLTLGWLCTSCGYRTY